MISGSTQPIEIFFCYAHEDKPFRNELDLHLAALKHPGLIRSWYDGEIVPGDPWEEVIKDHLNRAQIILLLISVSFLNSDYSYRIEMKRALERHNAGMARVIPVLLRPVDWEGTPISELQMLPTGAKPITSWPDRDAAFEDVAKGIRRAVNEMLQKQMPSKAVNPAKVDNLRAAEEQARQAEAARVRHVQKEMPPDQSFRQKLGDAGQLPLQTPVRTIPYIYRGHRDTVDAVAWSPDGKRIASGGADGTVQVWDAADGGHVFTYRGHSSGVYANGVHMVAWSPDGTRIASGSYDKTVQVWNAADGGHVYTYRGHKGWLRSVRAVAWSPDGKRIASGGDDNGVQVWDAADGGHVFAYRSGAKAVAWSPDGKRIASEGANNTVQVWDAADGGDVYTYRGHTSLVFAVAWSPDGTRIASGSMDKTVQVWNAE